MEGPMLSVLVRHRPPAKNYFNLSQEHQVREEGK